MDDNNILKARWAEGVKSLRPGDVYIHVSENWDIIGPGNGLRLVQNQAII